MHKFHDTRDITSRPGKERSYRLVTDLLREHRDTSRSEFRFMSLPGRDWILENHLHREIPARVLHTGFERDENVILQGRVNVPRVTGEATVNGWRVVSEAALPNVRYFKTNRGRWLHLDVNDALTLTPSCFSGVSSREERLYWYQEWLRKFCLWDGVWLDYYSPPMDKIALALNNLHYHCNPELETIPVAVTLSKAHTYMKFNENLGALLQDKEMGRRAWLEFQLGGGNAFPNISFETLEWFEYNDTSPMCMILGLIKR